MTESTSFSLRSDIATLSAKVDALNDLSRHDLSLFHVSPSDVLLHSHAGLSQTSSKVYVKVKETKFIYTGIIRVLFTIWNYKATDTTYGKIYLNDSPVGTERSVLGTTPETFTEDISIPSPGNIQIYLHCINGFAARVSDFLLKGDFSDYFLNTL